MSAISGDGENSNNFVHGHSHVHFTNHPTFSTPPENKRKRTRRKNTKRLPIFNTNAPLDTSSLVNLSNITLTDDETQLLARGLTFCPNPRQIYWSKVNTDFDEFSRRMRITEFFYDDVSNHEPSPYRPKSLWTSPTNRDDRLNAFLNAVKHYLITSTPTRIRDNLPKPQRETLRQLNWTKTRHYH